MNRKKYEKRAHILQVRMTEKEMEVAEHCAKRKKMTLSRYVRWCLFHKKTEISYNEDVFTEEMKEIIRQNTGAAVNLNQIARMLNTTGNATWDLIDRIRADASSMLECNRRLERMYQKHYGNSKTYFEQEQELW